MATTGATVEEIVAAFCRTKGIDDVGSFLRLLVLSEEAIESGLYVREFAHRTIYFRRVRVPPLTWIFLHNVTAGGLVGLLHRHLVRDKAAAVAEGRAAVADLRAMLRLAEDLGVPAGGIRFQLATFEILALLREVLFGLDTTETHDRLALLLPAYREAYPGGYHFDYAAAARGHARRPHGFPFRLLLRDRMDYRRGDRVLLNRQVTRLKTMAARRLQSNLPWFVDKQGMIADVLQR